MQRVVFVSRLEAEKLASHPDWIVISISGPEEKPANLAEGWPSILRLQFLDEDTDTGRGPLFNERMAQEVLAHAHAGVSAGKSVLVHCHAGVSRSAAVAIALGQVHRLPVYSGNVRLSANYSLHNKHVYRLLHRAITGYR